MKKQINITSMKKYTQASIRMPSGRRLLRRFNSIDEAVNFVLPYGDRQTEFSLNGFPCALNGWWDQT